MQECILVYGFEKNVDDCKVVVLRKSMLSQDQISALWSLHGAYAYEGIYYEDEKGIITNDSTGIKNIIYDAFEGMPDKTIVVAVGGVMETTVLQNAQYASASVAVYLYL